jgi:CRISPR-associated protein Csx10
MLAEHTGIQAKLLRSFTSTSVAGGWNVSWQRPKPTHHTTTQSSVFVFEADQSLDEAACIRLAQMQLEGIGERRPEGYGQIRICDEFHGLEQRSSDER